MENKCQVEVKIDNYTHIYHFWAPPEGGYVRIETDNQPGCLGRQITGTKGHAIEWDGKRDFKKMMQRYVNSNMK
jgi:hypothetical protein